MGSLNRVTLIGRLGADPELKYTPGGDPVCNFSLATSEQWKDKKSGEKKEATTWHRIVVWRELGENCAKYLAKGREACVEGKIQTRSYDKDGQKHWATDIVADRVIFLGGGNGERERSNDTHRTPDAGGQQRGNVTPSSVDDDDIPFLYEE